MKLLLKILSGMANSVDPDQTAPRSSLIWVCTVCIYHFVRHFDVQNFRTVTIVSFCRCVYHNDFCFDLGNFKNGKFSLHILLQSPFKGLIFGQYLSYVLSDTYIIMFFVLFFVVVFF